MDGWVSGGVDGRAGLRIAYSNQKCTSGWCLMQLNLCIGEGVLSSCQPTIQSAVGTMKKIFEAFKTNPCSLLITKIYEVPSHILA